MSWASDPTAEMPSVPVGPTGRHRRHKASVLGILAAGGLLVLAVAGAMLSPTLLGWPPPTTPAEATARAASNERDTSSLLAAATPPIATTSITPIVDPTPNPQVTATATAKAVTTKSAAEGIESLENEVLSLTNGERTKAGCAASRMDTNLRTAARNHSAEMASLKKLTHSGANGSSPGDRMKAAGYNASGGWAENVAAGYPTPQKVMNGWMSSEGHRANILNCSLKAIGVGVARASNGQLYWTQDFGGR